MRRALILPLIVLFTLPLLGTQVTARQVPTKRDSMVTVGHLTIARLNVKATIYKGVTDREFDLGVGYWPGTALPGAAGNMVIGGHRTAAGRPFYDIQNLKTGDIIIVSRPQRTVRYRVTKKFVVRPTDVWIIKPTTTPSLTLFTCHPRGSVSKRYVVRATLVR